MNENENLKKGDIVLAPLSYSDLVNNKLRPSLVAQCQQTAEDWNNNGNALLSQSKYGEAIQAYNKAIELDPNLATAWSNKGLMFAFLEEFDNAIHASDKAIKVNPQLAMAWSNKGIAVFWSKQIR